MKTITIHPTSIDERAISEAVEALRGGAVVIFPTDTLFAMGCNALDNRAIERLCRLKGINPDKNTLSIVCSDLAQAANYARIDNRAFALMRRNLPGPFTFILPAATTLPKIFKGRRQVGIRIPNNSIAQCLAEELGNPVMTTSAPVNEDEIEFGEVSADSIVQQYARVADIAILLDAGACGTIPSAVVDLTDSSDPQIIREGTLPLD